MSVVIPLKAGVQPTIRFEVIERRRDSRKPDPHYLVSIERAGSVSPVPFTCGTNSRDAMGAALHGAEERTDLTFNPAAV